MPQNESPTEYLTITAIAALLRERGRPVTGHTAANSWLARRESRPIPAPDVILGEGSARPILGWAAARIGEFEQFADGTWTPPENPPAPVAYLTTAGVAARLGIEPATAASWLSRYGPGGTRETGGDGALPVPAADVIVGGRSGWLPSRIPEWKAFKAARPRKRATAERAAQRSAEQAAAAKARRLAREQAAAARQAERDRAEAERLEKFLGPQVGDMPRRGVMVTAARDAIAAGLDPSAALGQWAPAIDDYADLGETAAFLGIKPESVSQGQSQARADGTPRMPAPDKVFGQSPSWKIRTLVIHLAGLPGHGGSARFRPGESGRGRTRAKAAGLAE